MVLDSVGDFLFGKRRNTGAQPRSETILCRGDGFDGAIGRKIGEVAVNFSGAFVAGFDREATIVHALHGNIVHCHVKR